MNEELEYWMTRLPESLKRLPIMHLAIPGSHNSMTYTITRQNDVGPDESRYIRALGRYCSFVSKPIIFNWSVTQQRNIKDQLNGGVRYIDLRVATKSSDGYIYFVHGLYGSKIYQPLQEIAEWLSSHTNEIVILDFQHFYSFTEMDHRHLVETISRIFQTKLCTNVVDYSMLTLHWLNYEKFQVIVIYRNEFARDYPILLPSVAWRTPWPNTVHVNELIKFLNDGLSDRREWYYGWVSQCLLTPNIPYILKHPCGSLQRNLVPQCQKAILSWIKQKQPGSPESDSMNIVIADFVADQDFLFCKTVIDSNRKLINT